MRKELKKSAGFHPRRLKTAGLAAVITLMGVVLPRAAAQEIPCDKTSSFPCGLEIRELTLQKVPPIFHFQTRVSQAKLPDGDTVLGVVVVKLVRQGQVLCTEQMTDVDVRGGTLNLTIGQDMDCDMDEVLAENRNLAFQVCLGGVNNCLKPIDLAATPYAIKATYANVAQQASRANVAAQSSWTHRGTADREHFLRKELGAGYFDFYTHTAADAAALYEEPTDYEPYNDTGFIQWTPVRSGGDARLHIGGKDETTQQLNLLDELVLAAQRTWVRGDLIVDPPEGSKGLTVTNSGLHVTGASDFEGFLKVTGNVEADDALLVTGDTDMDSLLVVADSLTVAAGGVNVSGGADIAGGLQVLDTLTVEASMAVEGTGEIAGLLTAANGSVAGPLTVGGNATIPVLNTDEMNVAGLLDAVSLHVAGTAEFGGAVNSDGSMEVIGETMFHGHVTFAAGTSDPNAEPDLRYVHAENELRKVNAGGRLTFGQGLALGGDLDLEGHHPHNFRYQMAAAPPVVCGPGQDGYFYFDTVANALTVCGSSAWRSMASGDQCGNHNVEPTEECDDGNADAGDGCSSGCMVEDGWSCTPQSVQPTTCDTTCGDGFARGIEGCDDGGLEDGDGCSAACTVEAGYACQGDPSVCQTLATCDIVYNGHCYWLFDQNMNWDSARAHCQASPRFGYLVAVGDLEEQQFISDLLIADTWNGLHDQSYEGYFQWVTESGQSAPGFAYWDGPEPNNWGTGEDCVEMAGGNGEWNDISCTSSNHVMCERNWTGAQSCCKAQEEPGCWDEDIVACVCAQDDYCCNIRWDSLCKDEVESFGCGICFGCGDGTTQDGEECDDQNSDNGDGCSELCFEEPGWNCSGQPSACEAACGDGIKAGTEECDDSNNFDADGCAADCTVEAGWNCVGDVLSVCTTVCGDGIVIDSQEECDDSDDSGGDGCSANCAVEVGYECDGEPSICTTICGDGYIRGAEACDDGDEDNGDGCSSTCTIEDEWVCSGEPSNCIDNVCGDGNKAGDEACDDGDKSSGDGCSSSCTVESGWVCSGNPSDCKKECTFTYNGHCYINSTQHKTWNDAKWDCVDDKIGGYLVRLDSWNELTTVYENGPSGNFQVMWIGMKRPLSSFVWTSTSPGSPTPSFFNWASGQPDHDGDCVEMSKSDGKWNDTGCNHVIKYVCERDSISSW